MNKIVQYSINNSGSLHFHTFLCDLLLTVHKILKSYAILPIQYSFIITQILPTVHTNIYKVFIIFFSIYPIANTDHTMDFFNNSKEKSS